MSDRNSANEILKELDLWLENGNIDPFRLKSVFLPLLENNEFERAQNLINALTESEFIEKIRVRVGTLQSFLNGIKGTISNKIKEDDSYQEVFLKQYPLKQFEVDDFKNIGEKDEGLYKKKENFYSIKNFEDCFSHSKEKNIFRDLGFSKSINSSTPKKIRIIKNARVHSFDSNFYALSTSDGLYDSSNSGRLSKITGRNLLKLNGSVLDKAIFLPFDAAEINYYHNLSEMVYGISFCKNFDDSYHIVYTSDTFGALHYLAEKLGIKKNRLVSIKDIDGYIIKEVISIHPIGYSWNKDIFSFFSQFRVDKKEKHKVYISRRGSKRSFSNEESLERHLKDIGFNIIKPETLTFEEQVKIFSNVDVLVAGHGAGLTNMLFMPKGSKIIEIFPPDYIKPDFYFRSIHNEINYQAVIANDNKVDIVRLVNKISNRLRIKLKDENYIEVHNVEGLKVDFLGKESEVTISENAVLHNVHLKLGNNCHIYIGETYKRGIRNTVVDMTGSQNSNLYIDDETSIESARFAMANESSCSIRIGKNCMLSSNVMFRATDGHVIHHLGERKALNRSKPIHIGDSVWIGSGVTILKGAQVANDSIIGTMSLVASRFEDPNIVIGGNPAKVIKTGIAWDRTYLKNWHDE